ncbi:MAG: M28 family peptidase [Haloferacaceae archaeon]
MLDAALGRAWTDDRPWDLLTELTDIGGRLGGSPAERAAADLLIDALDDAGVREVAADPFPTRAWRRGDSRLERGGTVHGTVALPYAPPADVAGDLVDVGHGLPGEIPNDLDGAVAVASTDTPPGSRFVHRLETFGAAVEAGAEGFVFANHRPGQLPPTGTLGFDAEAPAPGVGVSHETGERLRANGGGDDGSEEVRLVVESETVAGESRNVVGRVGPRTAEEVVLVAHYDAHDVGEGALDNGCGVAVAVAAAALLAAGEPDLERGVRVALVGCEETGLVGSEHLADGLDLDRVAGVVNVDGAGRDRDLVAMSHASDATRAVAERVADRTGHPVPVRERPHPFSDQWPFVRRGVPALQLHSGGGERGRGWTHTAADTRDKVDRRDLREHAMLAALLVVGMAGADLPRLETDALVRALRDAEYETGMRAAGLWPDEWD